MASALALKKLLSANLIPRSLRAVRPAAAAPAASHLFNTDAVSRFDGGDDDERAADVDRRSGRSVARRRDDFFPDVFDPFAPTRTLSQVLNLMDQFMDNPLLSATRGSPRRSWDAKETDDALILRIDMPGLSKEDVKIMVEQNTLVIKGEGPKEEGEAAEGEEGGGRRYTGRIDLPEKVYRTDQIKAEMKNGVLKVVVPKVKEEERKDVRHIEVS